MRRREFIGCLGAAAAPRPARVTLASLLEEMTGRDALARFPDPPYRCLQSSSYDRGSVAPGRPGWFANQDWSHFLRAEERGGRTEWVMMEADGPGAVVRIWMGAPDPQKGPAGTLRLYLDGAAAPAIEEEADKLLSGRAFIGPPLGAVRSIGRNLYLPVPFASHCKVTYDRPDFWRSRNREDRAWYVVEYRSYPKEVRVEPFSMSGFDSARPLVETAGRRLLEDRSPPAGAPLERALAPGERLRQRITGPAAIRSLTLRLEAPDLSHALRSTVLAIRFDGEETVWCPAGDFFGSGAGLNPYRDWQRTVALGGAMTCRWVMPYRRACEIRVENLGTQTVRAALGPVVTGPWRWDAASMYFHANWRRAEVETKQRDGFDRNYIEIRGQGVYAGDCLAIRNGAAAWWGEGDEKIFVDGEPFPSHFGTGTEDYYGYSFGDRGVFFEAPFHAQPRADGNNRPGHTTNTRIRSLDAIPFTRSLKFDMEVWHWAQTNMTLAAATYWYGRPGATSNRGPEPRQLKP